MRRIVRRIAAFFREDPGQDLIEYTLLIAFMALAAIAVCAQLGVTVRGPWSTANTTLAAAGGTATSSTTPAGTGGDQGGDQGGDHGDHDGR